MLISACQLFFGILLTMPYFFSLSESPPVYPAGYFFFVVIPAKAGIHFCHCERSAAISKSVSPQLYIGG
jgi:hypothetical protein